MTTPTYFRTVLFFVLSGLLLWPAIASAQEEVVYYHTDAIGSVRAITDHTGATIARYDYLPFGELWPTVPPPPNERRQFAGKERDFETTGLDYFGARYHRPVSGRFTTVDPVMNIEAALTDPQRWNRYSYATNRPFTMIDPDGRDPRFAWLVRIVQQASSAATRHGTSAYNWATRFFNTPTGHEVTSTAAEILTGGQLPFGFGSVAQFQQFGSTLGAGLSEVGGSSARAFLTGSAVTGFSFRTGAPFDVGRVSDFDIALVGQDLLDKATSLGVGLRGQGSRTDPLSQGDLKALGLDGLANRLSGLAGRPVNFMIYRSEEALRVRGSIVVPFF